MKIKSILKLAYLLLIVSVLSFSCSQKETEDSHTIHINLDQTPDRNNDLTDYISDIRFIPLETRSENMMDRINQLEIDESNIFCLADKTIFRFSWDGEFISKFCKEGNGPGEYDRIRQIRILPGTESLLISDRRKHKLLQYGFDGNYLNEISIPKSNGFFEILNGGTIALHLGKMFGRVNDTLCNDLVFLNMKGEVIDRQFQHNHPLSVSFGFPFSRPDQDGTYYYSRQFDFNLYSIKEAGKPEIGWKMDYGDLMGSIDELDGDDIMAFMAYRDKRKLTRSSQFLNTKEHLVFFNMWMGKKSVNFFNKKTQEMLYLDVDTLNNYSYMNDFPLKIPRDTYNDYFISVIEAIDLVDIIGSLSADNKRILAKKIESFNRLINISENDNPVLMFYKLNK